MLVLAGFAMTDLLALKEAVTVVAPDHKPLLALVALFGEPFRFFFQQGWRKSFFLHCGFSNGLCSPWPRGSSSGSLLRTCRKLCRQRFVSLTTIIVVSIFLPRTSRSWQRVWSM